jgi:hypothetical protein
LTAGEAKNADNAVVLARLFNEASGQKAPSKKHGLFISRPLGRSKVRLSFNPRKIHRCSKIFKTVIVFCDAIATSYNNRVVGAPRTSA